MLDPFHANNLRDTGVPGWGTILWANGTEVFAQCQFLSIAGLNVLASLMRSEAGGIVQSHEIRGQGHSPVL